MKYPRNCSIFFDNCELADLSLLNEYDRHIDKTELSPYLLNIISNQSQEPLLDITAKSLEARELSAQQYQCCRKNNADAL